jgi:hypothetical protein
MTTFESNVLFYKDALFTDGGSMKDAASRIGMEVFFASRKDFSFLEPHGATEFHRNLLEDVTDFSWDGSWEEGAYLLPDCRLASFTKHLQTRSGRFYVDATCLMPEIDTSASAIREVISKATASSLFKAFTRTEWSNYVQYVHSVGILPGEGQSDRGINFLVVPDRYDPEMTFRAIQDEGGSNNRFARFTGDMSSVSIGLLTKDAVWWENFFYIGQQGEEVKEHVWVHAWDETKGGETRFRMTSRSIHESSTRSFSLGNL